MVAKISLNQDQDEEESVTQKDEVVFTCYLPPVIPTSPKFSATGVHVDENANIYIHVMDNSKSIASC